VYALTAGSVGGFLGAIRRDVDAGQPQTVNSPRGEDVEGGRGREKKLREHSAGPWPMDAPRESSVSVPPPPPGPPRRFSDIAFSFSSGTSFDRHFSAKSRLKGRTAFCWSESPPRSSNASSSALDRCFGAGGRKEAVVAQEQAQPDRGKKLLWPPSSESCWETMGGGRRGRGSGRR